MNPSLLLIAILFPILAGALMPLLKVKTNRGVRWYVGAVTLLTSLFAWCLILKASPEEFLIDEFTAHFTLALRFDGLGRFFAGIVATLWPLTVLYAFEYMEEDERRGTFFAFFTMAYGVTLGITMSANLFTLYLFYEFLTLVTVPLVHHTGTKAAVQASRSYFAFSLGGAAFALVSIIYLQVGSHIFGSENLQRLFYLFGVFGFGVKAALFPNHEWLPKASVAPTPVTALLHAVAVVKSGVFAIMRLTYFAYDPQVLKGSWAQYVAMGFAAFTVFYGASKAIKEAHWKRRLAFSTIANLSYILVGVFLMTDLGLKGAMLHMAFHAEIKILAFFACGAMMHKTGKEYIWDTDGMGYRMPWTFAFFTVAALALTGIPPFSGFVSKWSILTAAAADGTPVAYVGAFSILAAALMTAIYCFSVVRRAYFPSRTAVVVEAEDPSLWMLLPMGIIAVGILLTGLNGGAISARVMEIVTSRVVW